MRKSSDALELGAVCARADALTPTMRQEAINVRSARAVMRAGRDNRNDIMERAFLSAVRARGGDSDGSERVVCEPLCGGHPYTSTNAGGVIKTGNILYKTGRPDTRQAPGFLNGTQAAQSYQRANYSADCPAGV